MLVAQLRMTRLQLCGLYPFHTVHGVLKARILKWFAIPLSSGPHLSLNDQPRKHIKKQGHYFANKVLSSQGMVFPVVMYGCESWNMKKVERRRMML